MQGQYRRYWGKAKTTEKLEWHPLAYHSLDVASVAAAWWEASPVIRARLGHRINEANARAWVLFFIALHDLGKFDTRFQARVAELHRYSLAYARTPSLVDINSYRHGPAGFAWFVKESQNLLGRAPSHTGLRAWQTWLAPVTGHHGHIPPYGNDALTGIRGLPGTDKAARMEWFQALEQLFLAPSGHSLADDPPSLDEGGQAFLAGFCSVCDWLGSDEAPGHFAYVAEPMPLEEYFHQRIPIAQRVLATLQLSQTSQPAGGFNVIYPNRSPRQVQTLVGDLPLAPGLTLIEAPTGSGKTEAALAYASRLLADGEAESILFALPTQATANAMLVRLEEVAGRLFPAGANLILAHGKSRYNPRFDSLKARALHATAQGRESASVECADWLAASRKRAFLGQIGVCTVDQVLLAVLPVRHAFIRGFGLGKGVLIVDEVHAYDSYMLGLLCEVLARQRQAGGLAVLLSATLPSGQKRKLISAWLEGTPAPDAAPDYPLITQVTSEGQTIEYRVDNDHRPPRRSVVVETCASEAMRPDSALIMRILNAARQGAKVAVICNLVADAQELAMALREVAGDIPVDLFHSRYRFHDRQDKETAVLDHYGPERSEGGRILVATQVVEQSLDLDFDWMVSHICPIDLLFQRLGRLHRHSRDKRPPGFELPYATVLIPPENRYGYAQEMVYSKGILWRTETLVKRHAVIEFPEAYRQFIEQVYDEVPWPDEPPAVTDALDEYTGKAMAKRNEALRQARAEINPFEDDNEIIRALTRAGEQGPLVLLTTVDGMAPLFRPAIAFSDLPEWDLREVQDLESIAVPDSWRGALPTPEKNRVYLPMRETAPGHYSTAPARTGFVYDRDYGLRKLVHIDD